ncbi:heavy metal translocating P-type ATPase [Campylobacter sp. RM16192]|uniref:heavy metal translocating P-type ATPase n=1 Tax=Campylobacter sp. RM16192 TaxID=1660080 RepID=UPI001451FED5|nr:heavy metal translocating P-type ATPase [Campylobacter sp. RM16192]QCD52146.1 copper-translocating P-type ATPase [Campylobacter sp. RM16192]
MQKNLKLNIAGMTCVNCSNAIERAVKKMDGVVEAKVNFANATGEFIVQDESIRPKIEEKIKKLGYEIAKDLGEFEKKRAAHIKNLRNNFISATIFSAIIMWLEMSGNMSEPKAFIMLFLALITLAICGKDFFIHAIGALKNRNFDMNVLVALGTSMAFLYSVFVFLAPNLIPENMLHMYVSGSAMIITFVLLGKYLEERSKAKAGDYLKSLMDMSPKVALVLKPDGQAVETEVANLKIGDIVVVKTGYNIPCDGVIINGGAEIDTSMLTGESLPVYKKMGDEVNAGTVNTNGYLNIKVTKLSSQTLLAQILNLLSDASTKKMPISRFADRVANIFVPTVIVISFVTFLVWIAFTGNATQGVLSAICVLIISCPCALGLATPIAIISSLSLGAKNGILVKNPEVIEIIHTAKYAIFDKTGTLTHGKISVNFTDIDEENLAPIAAIEAKSSHPISMAIVEYATRLDIKILGNESGFENIAGRGIRSLDENEIIVGNEEFLKEFNVEIPNEEKEKILKAQNDGNGVVLAAIKGRYVGFISLSDTLKESAKEVIDELKLRDITPVMLTGDNVFTAKNIAGKLGIEQVFAGVMPNEKFEIIQRLQKEARVIFVGDGINDSPSLKQADVGIAMSSGADIAKDAGDIVLIKNDLKSVLQSINLAKHTMKTIKENLFWAFIYNLIFIPVAAGVLYPVFGLVLTPVYGAIAMSFSSVTVVLNSIRLRFKKI